MILNMKNPDVLKTLPYVTGTKAVTPSSPTSDVLYTIPSTIDGWSQVTVYGDSNLLAANIKSACEDIRCDGDLFMIVNPEGLVESKKKAFTVESAEATPSASAQTLKPSGTDVLFDRLTVKGDSNLTAGNIKKGVSIFGVTGTYSSQVTYSPSFYQPMYLRCLDTVGYTVKDYDGYQEEDDVSASWKGPLDKQVTGMLVKDSSGNLVSQSWNVPSVSYESGTATCVASALMSNFPTSGQFTIAMSKGLGVEIGDQFSITLYSDVMFNPQKARQCNVCLTSGDPLKLGTLNTTSFTATAYATEASAGELVIKSPTLTWSWNYDRFYTESRSNNTWYIYVRIKSIKYLG